MALSFRVVIPVRYASSRLPGKPLLMLNGKTLIEHVYRNACESDASCIVIATDDARIAETAKSFDAQVCMTRSDHLSGTDRIAETALKMGWHADDIIVNVQGDEPQMPAANINQLAALLAGHESASMATLCYRIFEAHEYHDPNVVKVVKNAQGQALYFSRSPLPYLARVDKASLQTIQVYRHVGIYAYPVRYLSKFVDMPAANLEKIERLEQLRALENGDMIVIDECECAPGMGVDTLEDYQRLSQH